MALVLTSSLSVNGCPWRTAPSLVNARPRHITHSREASTYSPYFLNLRLRGITESTSIVNRKLTRTSRRESICRAQMSFIPADSGKALFCALAACAAFAQVMENNTKWGSFVSAPLIAMGTSMFLSGIQFIPVAAQVYDSVFTLIMPMAVSLSLLEIDVKQAFSDAGITLKAFWLGAFGTVLGTIISFKIVGHALGVEGWKIASSLCASYIGGSINYAATAQALGLTSSSMLAAGIAADNLVMAGYFALIFSLREKSIGDGHIEDKSEDSSLFNRDVESSVESISVSLAAAAVACTAGDAIAKLLPLSFAGSSLAIMAIITSLFSSTVAQLSGVSEHANIRCFAGAQKMGASLMLLFFSVIGASTSLKEAISGGGPLFVFIFLLIFIHLLIILFIGRWLKFPLRTILVASNANIGGPATAAAMANCRNWKELVQPAILVGTLGYTIGTAVGCLIGLRFLRPMQ
ncbi:uncharacterized protein LOC131052191 isoform X1 [Cryptomeria japonica]|uniref:uncharacterized protein LOC131052191 isoform X1 n=1 Tax=Cryptomeria japonica TaxID=3369 RepID=UPI0027DA4378|nr:uncharacterized protein LOC131052191 isoform X1 [Cryptomeria japonica]